MSTVNAFVASLIRTYVPVWVSAGIVWVAVHFGIVLDKDLSNLAAVVAVGIVLAVYYAAARLVEQRWPLIGRILLALGLTSATPTYEKPAPAPLTGYRTSL